MQLSRPNAIVAGPDSLGYASQRQKKSSIEKVLLLILIICPAVHSMSTTFTLTSSTSSSAKKGEPSGPTRSPKVQPGQPGKKPNTLQCRGTPNRRPSLACQPSGSTTTAIPQTSPENMEAARSVPLPDLVAICHGMTYSQSSAAVPKQLRKASSRDSSKGSTAATNSVKKRRASSHELSLPKILLPPPIVPPRRKLVILLRHAESRGNNAHATFGKDSLRYLNPELSRTGKVSASVLPYIYPGLRKLLKKNGVVLVSPLQRALQTMIMAFSSDLESGLIAHEVIPALKTAKKPDDSQSWSPEGLQQDIWSWNPWLNLSNIIPPSRDSSVSIDTWQPKIKTFLSEGIYRSNHEQPSAAVSPSMKHTIQLKKILAKRKEDVILLVAHAGTFRLLIGQKTAKFANAQPQVFSLSSTATDVSLQRLEVTEECRLLGIPVPGS